MGPRTAASLLNSLSGKVRKIKSSRVIPEAYYPRLALEQRAAKSRLQRGNFPKNEAAWHPIGSSLMTPVDKVRSRLSCWSPEPPYKRHVHRPWSSTINDIKKHCR